MLPDSTPVVPAPTDDSVSTDVANPSIGDDSAKPLSEILADLAASHQAGQVSETGADQGQSPAPSFLDRSKYNRKEWRGVLARLRANRRHPSTVGAFGRSGRSAG